MADYHETKAKGIIREALFKAVEVCCEAEAALKNSGNPYAAIDVEQEISDQMNKLANETYEGVRKCTTFNC